MGAVVRLAAAYASLTEDQLREMLGAAACHPSSRDLRDKGAMGSRSLAALRQAITRSLAHRRHSFKNKRASSLLYNVNSTLCTQRLAKANAVITEQGRKLAAHPRVVELEQKREPARRMASSSIIETSTRLID